MRGRCGGAFRLIDPFEATAEAVCSSVTRRLLDALPAFALVVSACVGTVQGEGSEASRGLDAGATSDDSTTSAGSSESGAALEGCGENLLGDPGFEGGSPNEVWVAESDLFGTPICSIDCTDDVGAGPFVGDWWVWFGGLAQPDTAFVRQSVSIPEGMAMLRFGFSVNAGAGTGNDVFTVSVDEMTQLQITDAEAESYGGWRLVEVDVSSFADGEEHVLSFSASIAGVGVTNFFVDEVELRSCEDGSSSSSG